MKQNPLMSRDCKIKQSILSVINKSEKPMKFREIFEKVSKDIPKLKDCELYSALFDLGRKENIRKS